MSEITDVNEFRKIKERRNSDSKLVFDADHGESHVTLESTEAVTRKQYDQYIELMRLVIRTAMQPKLDLLYLDCIAEDDADFRDQDNEILDYRTAHSLSFSSESEKEDIIIRSIINYAPKKIIVRNSEALNAYFLYAIKGIFKGLVQVES
jgi:hypothetical protein